MGAIQLKVTVVAFFFIILLIIIKEKFDKQKIEFVNIRISGKKFQDFDIENIINIAKNNTSGLVLKESMKDESVFTILIGGVFTDYSKIISLRNEILAINSDISFTYMDNIGGGV